MPTIAIEIDEKQFAELSKTLGIGKKKLATAVMRGVNRAATRLRTMVDRSIRRNITAPRKRVVKNIKLRKATRSRTSASLRLEGRAIPLRHFQARQTRRGVAARIDRGGKRRVYTGTFIATMPSGHEGVYRRKGRSRLPIKEYFGPSIVTIYEQTDMGDDVESDASEVMEKEIARQIDRFTGARP